MYKFPDISRWFDIVDYVEYNGCRKIEVNMKKLSYTEISEFCNEFALFICRLRCPSQDWLLKMERAIKGVAGLDVTDKIVLRNMFYTGFISDIRYKETGDYLQSFDDEGIKGYFGECFYYILRDQILEDEKVYIEPRYPKNSSKIDLGRYSPQFEEQINEDFTTRTIRYLIALTDALNGEIDGVVLCPGDELGKHFTYVAEKSFKCQRSIPMNFFDKYKGKVWNG